MVVVGQLVRDAAHRRGAAGLGAALLSQWQEVNSGTGQILIDFLTFLFQFLLSHILSDYLCV